MKYFVVKVIEVERFESGCGVSLRQRINFISSEVDDMPADTLSNRMKYPTMFGDDPMVDDKNDAKIFTSDEADAYIKKHEDKQASNYVKNVGFHKEAAFMVGELEEMVSI